MSLERRARINAIAAVVFGGVAIGAYYVGQDGFARAEATRASARAEGDRNAATIYNSLYRPIVSQLDQPQLDVLGRTTASHETRVILSCVRAQIAAARSEPVIRDNIIQSLPNARPFDQGKVERCFREHFSEQAAIRSGAVESDAVGWSFSVASAGSGLFSALNLGFALCLGVPAMIRRRRERQQSSSPTATPA